MDIFISERYIIHEGLGSGGMGAVYRATDRLTKQTVALKRVLTVPMIGSSPTLMAMPETPSPTIIENFDLKMALAREFQMLATLRHPNIIDVLDYGFDIEGLPFFTMRLLEKAQNILEAAKSLSYLQRLDLAIQMIQALSYLHRRDILHRDIKPNNLLVAHNQLYMVDFGLAQSQASSSGPAGSVPYVAPEILQGNQASQASDIYAAGIILYQLFIGHHPFQQEDQRLFIDSILSASPDFSPLDEKREQLRAEGIEPKALQYVISQMLEKSPENRPSDTEAVIYALAQCANYSISVETVEIHESVIRTPSFVGREAELAELEYALQSALEGKGSAWLIGGESGAGKSRLLEEIRIRALVKGALVVRGQAHSDGTFQHLWGDIPRRLALAANLSAAEAAQLYELVPDIFELRDLPPTFLPATLVTNDLNHIVDLWLMLLTHQSSPIVIIMEDLHWATLEELRILQRLHSAFSRLPILWIGSYRDDEYPALPKRFPYANLIKLRRFEVEEIVALSESILGTIRHNAQLIDLLERETGGNPLLIVEIIRALASQAGTLRGIIELDIPNTLRTSNAQALIQRRLEHIPHVHRPLLAMAALIGRELDLSVLRAINADVNLNQWLTDNLNAAILTKIENQWYIAHEQLRQGILEYYILDEQTRCAMHLQVANAIERVYGDIRQKASMLAYHYHEGQDHLKARHYSAVAGEYLMQTNSPHMALAFLERATELSANPNLPAWSPLRRAHLLRLLGDAYFYVGQTLKARESLFSAAELLGEYIPRQPTLLKQRLQEELLEQYQHQADLLNHIGTITIHTPRMMETVRILDRLSEVASLLSEQELAQYVGLRGVNLAEHIGVSDLLAQLYATAARIFHIEGDFETARTYSRLAVSIASSINNPSILGWSWLQRANIAMLHADWPDILLAVNEAIPIFQELKDNRRLEELWSLQAFLELQHRADLDIALKTRQRISESAKQRGDIQFLIWGLNGQAEINIYRFDQLQTTIRQTEQSILLTQENQFPMSVRALGLSALAYFHLGDYETAQIQAQRATEALRQLGDTVIWRINGIDSALQVLYLLHETRSVRTSEVLADVAYLQYRLSHMVTRAPIAAVYAQRWLGTRAWIEGNFEQAEAHWQSSLEYAQHWQMPLQYARTLVEYARHLSGGARYQMLDDAMLLYTSCDATTEILYIRQLG